MLATPQELVESCLSLVHHLARQYASQNNSLSYDDLVGEGYVGLVQAAEKFQEGRGVRFSTFATTRIRGAMLDALRRGRPLSRPMAEKLARLAALADQQSNGAGPDLTVGEVAKRLRLSPSKAGEVMRMRSLRLVSLEHQAEEYNRDVPDSDESPEDQAMTTLLYDELRSHVAELPERDRDIIYRIYWLHEKHSEVARDLGISESRVSQLQSRAVGRLRDRLVPDQAKVAA